MNNNININGTLHIQCECAKCGESWDVKYYYDCNDWLTGYDIDITLSNQVIVENLMKEGWKEIDGKFICPECADEMKGD